tara:strand:- start:310 stop:492 length:183 start_codon:yes stop_codon:yes gene_type:complete
MTQKKGDSYHDIPNYIRHYVESTERGHIIKIVTEGGVATYNCKWSDYKRTKPLTKREAED